MYYDDHPMLGFRLEMLQHLRRHLGTVTHIADSAAMNVCIASTAEDTHTLYITVFVNNLRRLHVPPAAARKMHYMMHIGGGLSFADFTAMRVHGLPPALASFAAVYSYIPGIPGTVQVGASVGTAFCDTPQTLRAPDRRLTRLCVVADDKYVPATKNIGTIIKAWQTLRAEGYTLAVGGGGWRQKLLATVPEHMLEGVDFLGGAFLTQPAMIALYDSSDVFVVDSTPDDGFPTTCGLEAMARGCALVASNAQDNRALLVAGTHYEEFTHCDPVSMVQAIKRVTPTMAAAGQHLVLTNCVPDVALDPIVQRLRKQASNNGES